MVWEEVAEEENLDGLSEEQLETFRQRAVPVPGGILREGVELTNDARRDIPSTVICTGFTSEQYKDAAKEGHSFLAGVPELRDVDLGRPADEPLADVVAAAGARRDHRRRREGRARCLTRAHVSRTVHRLTRVEARRIAIRAQLLDAERPTDLLELIRHLTFLQLDPTAVIAPSADLVAWTRLGDGYRPEALTQALEQDGALYEVRAIVRPTADLALHLAAMAAWPFADEPRRYHAVPGPAAARWLDANDAFRRDVLARLRESGPLQSRDIPDTSAVPWQSSGWTGNRNVTQMLEFLSARGEVATSRRSGRQRLWDLAERVYPAVDEIVPLAGRAGSWPSGGCAPSASPAPR